MAPHKAYLHEVGVDIDLVYARVLLLQLTNGEKYAQAKAGYCSPILDNGCHNNGMKLAFTIRYDSSLILP